MAKKGRPVNPDTPVKLTINIPEKVYARLQLLFFDPVVGRARYGKLSGLVTNLLQDWLGKQNMKP